METVEGAKATTEEEHILQKPPRNRETSIFPIEQVL